MRRLATAAAVAALVTITPVTASAETYFWKWAGPVVYYYDGTQPANGWKVAEAAAEWSGTGTGPLFVPTSDPTAADITVTEGYTGSAGYAGWTLDPYEEWFVSCTITLDAGRLDAAHPLAPQAEHVAAHEFGHCAGLAHTGRSNSIMTALYDPAAPMDGPTGWDLSELRSHYR